MTYFDREDQSGRGMGILFSNTMKPADHVTHAVNKANQILGLTRRSFIHLDQQLMKQRFTALVRRPHVEYGNGIWYPHLHREINLIECSIELPPDWYLDFTRLAMSNDCKK